VVILHALNRSDQRGDLADVVRNAPPLDLYEHQQRWIDQYIGRWDYGRSVRWRDAITAPDVRDVVNALRDPRARWSTPPDAATMRRWLEEWYYWPDACPPSFADPDMGNMGETVRLAMYPRGSTDYADFMTIVWELVQSRQRRYPGGVRFRSRVRFPVPPPEPDALWVRDSEVHLRWLMPRRVETERFVDYR
jgi:hypothetical protein